LKGKVTGQILNSKGSKRPLKYSEAGSH